MQPGCIALSTQAIISRIAALLLNLHPFRAVPLLAAMEKPQTHYSHEFLCHTWGSGLQDWNSKTQQSCKSSSGKTVETRTPKLINLDSRDDCFQRGNKLKKTT